MNSSPEAATLTDTLLATVRLQRHLGTRVIVSTQEPTVSPALLNLSSVTIVHRFTSPEWLRTLKGHLAGVAADLLRQEEGDKERIIESAGRESVDKQIFNEIVNLTAGEALLFSPSAMVSISPDIRGRLNLKRLGTGYLKIHVRSRLTIDGGRSIMAV